MISLKIQILVIIMCNQSIHLCSSSNEANSLVTIESSEKLTMLNDDSLEITTSTVKKKPRTYKKRKTTCTSIRSTWSVGEIHSVVTTESKSLPTSPIVVPVESSEITKPSESPSIFSVSIDAKNTETIQTSECSASITSPEPFIDKSSESSKPATDISTKKNKLYIMHMFTKIHERKNKLKPNPNTFTPKKKPLDRRRLVIMGGERKEQSKMTMKFTLKYSPIKLQSIHQQVLDLRKLHRTTYTTQHVKPIPHTELTTSNKYILNIERFKQEYAEIISEERQYNETLVKNRKKEELEMQLAQESMQKSYLYRFIVTKVTTESWEKDLPVSSKGADEGFLDEFAAKLDQEPIYRRNFFVRKAKIQNRIAIEQKRLEAYRNATNKRNAESRKGNKGKINRSDIGHGPSLSDESLNAKNKRKHIEKRKLSGNIDDESEDGDETRFQGKHHPKQNQKKSTNYFQPNEHAKMMQEGWIERIARKSLPDMETRKEDAMDIYEPDRESKDEVERMKSYDITSNQQFIQYLKDNNFVQDERILEAIHWVDRNRFAKDGYVDSPHNYGTNSIVERPSYQALCLKHLSDKLVPGANVLDLGFGSGFMSCCMARLVGDNGHVTAVEHINQLVNLLLTKLKVTYPKLYKLYKVMDVVDWDARKPYKKNGPYDVIHFGGGVKHIPLEFIPDLKINGSILVPVGPPYGPHILKKITLIKRNVYTIQNLAEVEALHFCSPEEQVHDFRQIYGHHFIKMFSLFYKTVQPFNSTVTGQLHTYKLPDTYNR